MVRKRDCQRTLAVKWDDYSQKKEQNRKLFIRKYQRFPKTRKISLFCLCRGLKYARFIEPYFSIRGADNALTRRRKK